MEERNPGTPKPSVSHIRSCTARRVESLHPMGRARRLWYLVATVPMLVGGGGSVSIAVGGQQDHRTNVVVDVAEGTLSVDADGPPLTELIGLIAERLGARAVTAGDLTTRVSARFARVPVDEAIRRVTRGHQLVLVYARRAGRERLAEIRVLGSTPLPGAGGDGPEALPASVSHDRRASGLQAIRELARRRDAGALAQVVTQDADPQVRTQAALALSALGGAQAALALAAALGDQVTSVRIQAIHGLRKVEGVRAVPVLREVLMSDPDSTVRRTAVRALAQLPAQEARAALEPALGDPDASLRLEAAEALEGWRDWGPDQSGSRRAPASRVSPARRGG